MPHRLYTIDGAVRASTRLVRELWRVRDAVDRHRSVVRYAQMERKQWVMFKEGGRPADPAQIILLTLAINYVQGVEDAFTKMQEGNANGADSASFSLNFSTSTSRRRRQRDAASPRRLHKDRVKFKLISGSESAPSCSAASRRSPSRPGRTWRTSNIYPSSG